jgi:hypothetical protein
MGLGPGRDGEVTFLRLDIVPGWNGIPDVEEAGPRVLVAYLRAFGPAVPERVHDWLGKGLGAKRAAITRWIEGLDDRLVTVTIEGTPALALCEDIDDLDAARPSTAIRLLPGRDPWVMAPGTRDPHIVPSAHRAPVRGAANVVVLGGAVAGTWTARHDRLDVRWFEDPGPLPNARLADVAARLADFLGRPLELP